LEVIDIYYLYFYRNQPDYNCYILGVAEKAISFCILISYNHGTYSLFKMSGLQAMCREVTVAANLFCPQTAITTCPDIAE